MEEANERRREERLRYQWPVWFSQDFSKAVSQGLMVDVSSGGVAFTCNADENCPQLGQRLVTRFSIPRLEEGDSSATTSFTRRGHVCRTDKVNRFVRRIAVQFDEALSLKPAEQASIDLMRSRNPMA